MLKKLATRLAVLVVALLPFLGQPVPAAAASTGTLFAISGMSQSIFSSVDPATGAITPIEDLAGPNQGQLVSITGDPATHRIFADRQSVVFIPPSTINVTTEILTINSLTGAFTVSGPVNEPVGQSVFDPSTGSLYLLGIHGIFRVDPATGATTLVSSLGTAANFASSMAVVPGANRIYVSTQMFNPDGSISSAILTVNTLDGSFTTSPNLPIRVEFIVFDPSSGLLMSSDAQNLYQLDPINGTATTIANFNTDPSFVPTFAGAVDPTTNTVYVHIQSFPNFFTTNEEVVSVNDKTGAFSVSPVVTGQLWSLYFETPAPVITPDSIIADVNSALSSGAITNAGVANSLLAELNQAKAARDRGQCATAASIYRAFINDVQAQSGKAISAVTASQLVSEAQFLIANCP
jgi:FIMAH domain-containing protein